MSTGYRNRISLLLALGLVGGLFMMDRATARDTLADKIAAFGRTLRGADDEAEMDEGEPLSAQQSESGARKKPSRSYLPKVQAGDIVPKNFFGAAEQPIPRQRVASASQRATAQSIAESFQMPAADQPTPRTRQRETPDSPAVNTDSPKTPTNQAKRSNPAGVVRNSGGGLEAFLNTGMKPVAPVKPEVVVNNPVKEPGQVIHKPAGQVTENHTLDLNDALHRLDGALSHERTESKAESKEKEIIQPPAALSAAVPEAAPPAVASRIKSAVEGKAPARPMPKPSRGDEVLISSGQPAVSSRVEGPRQIVVGKEATFRVILKNQGDSAAESIVSRVQIPANAELTDTVSTGGIIEQDNGEGRAVIVWRLLGLKPGAEQTLTLQLVPQTGKPMPLAVQWEHAPATSQALVEVQEPKLQIAIKGPDQVLYGKGERFKLILSNPGTGAAENVVVELVPPGQEGATPTSHSMGPLAAGESREVELELTAREAGELVMHASARADTGLVAHVEKQVVCTRPELEVDWRGPEKKYAGTVAAYYFRVRNPGTAPTESVEVSLDLPPEAEFVAASEGHSVDAKSGRVMWKLAGLAVGEERFMQVRCRLNHAGENRMRLTAAASKELTQAIEPLTDVVALADLKLEVSDPRRPVPVGEDAVYEVRVVNRGTTAARGVNVVGLFSEGIDPTSVEGAQFKVQDGRVTFETFESLAAGADLKLRIHAKASRPGTHVFRAEVICQDLEVKLASEETTRFYEDEFRWEEGETPYTAKGDSDGRYR